MRIRLAPNTFSLSTPLSSTEISQILTSRLTPNYTQTVLGLGKYDANDFYGKVDNNHFEIATKLSGSARGGRHLNTFKGKIESLPEGSKIVVTTKDGIAARILLLMILAITVTFGFILLPLISCNSQNCYAIGLFFLVSIGLVLALLINNPEQTQVKELLCDILKAKEIQ